MATHRQKIVSSGRLPNAQHSEFTLLERQQRSLGKVQRYLDAPVEEDILVNDNTKAHRQWLMRIWNKYFHDQSIDPDDPYGHIDPDTIWTGLCEGDETATAWTKAFFSDYVEHSVRPVMVLGPGEYEDKRMVNSASTLLAMWRKLVKEADLTVLKAKRKQEPRAGDKWRLRFHNHNARMPTSSTAIFEISKWIWTELARESRLTKELTFEKVEATDEDVIVILRTLWERAAELGIDPDLRIAFHANVLLSAAGGFRPGCLRKIPYKDFVLSILRDPRDSSKMKHAATIAIKRNKIKDSLSFSKTDKVKFSVLFIPFPLVCLGRLIVARAIRDNAFDPGFADAEEFLKRPVLGDVDYIELKWKDEVLDRTVFNLSYRQFNDIWHRVCMAAGLRVEPRLYALRVGAGARLDEHPLFSNALRNHILSHTNTVFESQYQTSRIREDLLQAAFGQRTGSDNSPLFALLRNISLSRDLNAPIDLTPDEWTEFETRDDATTLRAAIAEARKENNQGFLVTLRSRFGRLRHSWKSLKLADSRRRYFEEADRLRAQGQQPPGGQENVSNHLAAIRSCKSNARMASQVLQHILRKWNTSNDDEDPGRYIHLLVAYLNRYPKVKLDAREEEEDYGNEEENDESETDDDGDRKSENEDEDSKEERPNETRITDGDYFRCVICDLGYSSRITLTGHYQKHVKEEKLFDQPLQCSECRRNKINASVEKGYLAWLNHLERFHGERFTPHFPQALKYPEKYPCPFTNCGTQRKGKNYNSRGLTYHFSRGHVDEQDTNIKDKFKDAILCHRCVSRGAGEGNAPLIDSIWGWRSHFDSVHCNERQSMYQCFLCLELIRTAGGLKSHFCNLHERRQNFFAKPFRCPECIRTGHADVPEVEGRKAWQEHIDQCHNGGAKEGPLDSALCLICLKGCYSRDTLVDHLSTAHRELFNGAFQCPECVRQGNQDTGPFDSQHTWILHVLRDHPAHGTNLDACFDTDYLDASPTPASSNSRRAKRKRVKKLDSELDAEVGLPDPPQCCVSSTASTMSCDSRSGNWDLLSEKGLASDTTDTDLDDMIFARLENAQGSRLGPRDGKRKREMVEDGHESSKEGEDHPCQHLHRNVSGLSTASHLLVDSEDIAIDPYLLGLK